jgi:ADP-heptose:LPS heptosyltransferase
MKILTINFGGIGDEILFLPALSSIRAVFPEARISLLLEPRSRSFEQVTDLVDEILTFDIKKRPLKPQDLWSLLRLIQAGKFDIVVSSGSSPPVAALLFLSGIKKRVGYGANPLAKLLLTDAVPLNREQYAAAMYQDLATGIGAEKLPLEKCLPVAVLKPESVQRMSEFLAAEKVSPTTGGKKRILLHPGTSKLAVQKGIIKTWATEHWLHLIDGLAAHEDLQLILAGGPDDAETISDLMQEVQKRSQQSTKFLSAFGKTKSLADLAALIDMCDLLVCVDSAPMHLAVALKKPVVALFGPTDEGKLLPPLPIFKGLRDKPISEFPRQLGDGLGVPLQPDIVYQSVLDQLRESRDQGSHQATLH